MITLQLLEKSDTIEPTDWCRPLSIVSMSGGHSDYYSFKSAYGGGPENNAEWVRVKDMFGMCWFGSTVANLNTEMKRRYEFVRGPVPKSNQLDMTDYVGLDYEDEFDVAKTFNEWKSKGYVVVKGSKSPKNNKNGEPVFTTSQVKKL